MTTRYIYALDPGLKSGVCVFTLNQGQEPELKWHAEQDVDDVIPTLRSIMNAYPELEVVVERFVVTADTAKKSPQQWSTEIIGTVKQTMRDFGRSADEIYFQKPADAMNLFPNKALQKLGYWHRGGADHANDAIRHGLLYMSGNGWMPTRLLD
jgi:hypothetical protein